MVDELPQRQTAIFVVRLWAEYLIETPPEWRGKILHPESGRAAFFQDPDQLQAFMVSCAVEGSAAGEAGRKFINPGE